MTKAKINKTAPSPASKSEAPELFLLETIPIALASPGK